jgi:chromosome segregation ATPase
MSDLTDRLRHYGDGPLVLHDLLRQAADEIDQCHARIEALQNECDANNDEVILLTAERDALREQLTLAESVRAAQVAGLTEGAENVQRDAARYRATLVNVRLALDVANTTPNGPICDTIWYSDHETLFDYIDAALKGEA